jgi:hypothetical protein
VPRPKDSKAGIPQTLVLLFEECLHPLRRGLGVAGLALAPAVAERQLEVALVRAWQVYRKMAVECLVTWADIDDRYQASSARFQEMRWEIAGEADVAALTAKRADDEQSTAPDPSVTSAAPAVVPAAPDTDAAGTDEISGFSQGSIRATDRSGADLAVATVEA